jgi:hypothetical protein
MTKITIAPSARTQRAIAELADNLIRVRIDGATADEQLAQRAQAIRVLGKRTIANVIEIGHHLVEAKTLCGHGNWLPWLDREFGWSDKQAERFMQMHSMLGKFDKLSNLDVPMSALYLLASPSTPEAVRQEVIERVERGEKVSVAEVSETITKAKTKLVPSKPEAKPSYLPDEIINQIVDLFLQLTHNDQNRCCLRLRTIFTGRTR